MPTVLTFGDDDEDVTDPAGEPAPVKAVEPPPQSMATAQRMPVEDEDEAEDAMFFGDADELADELEAEYAQGEEAPEDATVDGWDVDSSIVPYLRIEPHLVQRQQMRLPWVLGRVVEQLGLAKEVYGEAKTELERVVAVGSRTHRKLLASEERTAYLARKKIASGSAAGTVRVPSETAVRQAVIVSAPYQKARAAYDAAKAAVSRYQLRVDALRSTLDQLKSLGYFQGAETNVLRSSMTEQ